MPEILNKEGEKFTRNTALIILAQCYWKNFF